MKNKLQAILSYYLMKLATEQLSSSTKRTYASLVRQFVNYIEESEPVSQDIAVGSFTPLAQHFLAADCDGKASSINARASAIKHFLKTSGIPCETLERPQTRLTTREPLTEAQLNAFLEAARQSHPRDKAVAFIFSSTGIRLRECVDLNLDSLDSIQDTYMLAVERGGHRQQIPLNAETQKALAEYLDTIENPASIVSDLLGCPLLVDKHMHRLSMRSLSAIVRKIGWTAKLVVSPAVLRLTRLIQIARNGNDPVTMAYLGGFDSLESARRIIKACENDLTMASVQAEIAAYSEDDLAEQRA